MTQVAAIAIINMPNGQENGPASVDVVPFM
jgi:hypothetical protein